ncbi:MAG: GNAT family N-acetyltransferase [Acidimicrobiales bacterium]
MSITYRWRGGFDNVEINRLHAEAFETDASDRRDWHRALTEQSLGWVTARDDRDLVGFVNVVWDGLVHAWIQDTMVTTGLRSQGVGVELVNMARKHAKDAGCKWLHVDFDDSLGDFYFTACGFSPTPAGLIALE